MMVYKLLENLDTDNKDRSENEGEDLAGMQMCLLVL